MFFVILSSMRKLFGNINTEILEKSETILRVPEHGVGEVILLKESRLLRQKFNLSDCFLFFFFKEASSSRFSGNDDKKKQTTSCLKGSDSIMNHNNDFCLIRKEFLNQFHVPG